MDPLDRMLRFFGHSLGLPSQYVFMKKIGEGAEGQVWLATDTERRQLVAIKLIPRECPHWQIDMVRRETAMLARLGYGHVNIVRAFELLLTTKHFAVVMEYVSGGSVGHFLEKHKKMDEDLACYMFKQLLAAISFCHAHLMAYRDVKPGNTLVMGWPPLLKLCDFGLAQTWAQRGEPTFETLAGTPGYMPPQIMKTFIETHGGSKPGAAAAVEPGEGTLYNGVKADVYSMGVMLCVLMLRHMPWEYQGYAGVLPPLEAMKKVYHLLEVEGVSWRDATAKTARLSEPLKDLLDGMLTPDEDTRLSMEAVAAHPWVNRPLPAEYTSALELMVEQQAALEAATQPFTEEQLAARLEVIGGMLDKAGRKDKGYKLLARLPLTRPLAKPS